MDLRHQKAQGMNWIRREKRLAIYIRDGVRCVYCRMGPRDGRRLSLDHREPYSTGGTTDHTNLITCCLNCNGARNNRPLERWATTAVRQRVERLLGKPIHVGEAKQAMAKHGGFSQAVAALA